jgi:hypothetical protein
MEKTISKFVVFQEYMKRARDFFEMGKIIDNDEKEFWNSAFLYSISLELGCKSFLLYHNGEEFENLPFDELKKVVNILAKKWGHQLTLMFEKIQEISYQETIKSLLLKRYRCSSDCIMQGSDIVKILESCYFEIRYPMPKSIVEDYPISDEKDSFYDVTLDSNLPFFVDEVLREIQEEVAYKESVQFPRRRGSN